MLSLNPFKKKRPATNLNWGELEALDDEPEYLFENTNAQPQTGDTMVADNSGVPTPPPRSVYVDTIRSATPPVSLHTNTSVIDLSPTPEHSIDLRGMSIASPEGMASPAATFPAQDEERIVRPDLLAGPPRPHRLDQLS